MISFNPRLKFYTERDLMWIMQQPRGTGCFKGSKIFKSSDKDLLPNWRSWLSIFPAVWIFQKRSFQHGGTESKKISHSRYTV